MHRRHYLAVAAAFVGAGSGCLSGGKSAGTEPLTGSFGRVDEANYWHLGLDGLQDVTTADSLYALTQSSEEVGAQYRYRSTLTRVSPGGQGQWSVECEHATQQVRVAGGVVCHFRSENPYENSMTHLSARDAGTGEHRWTRPVEPSPSFLGTTDGAVFLGATTDDPARLPVTAVEADSGERRWQTVTRMPRNGVVTDDWCLVHGYPDSVLALNARTGETHWEKQVGSSLGEMRVVGNTLYVLSDAGVTAYALASGETRWDRSLADTQHRLLVAESAAVGTDTVYAGDWGGTVRALDADTGETRWSKGLSTAGDGNRIGGLTQSGQTVVATKGNTLYGFAAETGTEQWRQVLGTVHELSPPVVADGTVFILHAPESGELVVKTFDLDSGERRWRYRTESSADHFPRPTVYADRVVVSTRSGDLFGFRVD